jgi:ribulose-5-phosphate 4-epimerase/fuculose-1-phosphate aldolase
MAVVEVRESIEAEVRQARVDLAAAYQIAARLGLNEGVDNHFTVRVPGTTDRFLINPRDLHWSEIRASDILMVDADGRVLEGRRTPPRSGICIHIPIHQAHPRGGCVFHTHMPYATALAALRGGRLEMVHQNSARFHDDVAYDDEFNGIATDPAEGRRMARAFGDRTVLFLANHGVIVATDTVAEAIDGLYYLERAAQVQVLAMSTGRPLQVMEPELARRTRSQFGNIPAYALRHFEAQKRLLDRDGSHYAS